MLHDAESRTGDLEQASTVSSSGQTTRLEEIKTQSDIQRIASSARNRRIDNLTRRRSRFSHVLSHTPTQEDVLVDFDGDEDPYRPLNWPLRKKIVTTLLYGLTTMCSTWASSVYSPAVNQIAEEFHVGPEVSLLGLSLLLAGFGLGPLLWAPLSEVYGRKPAVLTPYFLAAVFSFSTATAKDFQTIMISRFFTGFFGSSPVSNTGMFFTDA